MCDVLAEAGAFVNAALGLPEWLWCVTFAWNTWARLWTLCLVCRDDRGVCYVCVMSGCAWFVGMIVVCVTFV